MKIDKLIRVECGSGNGVTPYERDLSSVVKELEGKPLEELAPLFEMLASRLWDHRNLNNGYVPLSIFPHCVGVGGVYPCCEVVVRVVDNSENSHIGFALKKRGKGEQAWQGQYQITGVAATLTRGSRDIFAAIAGEILGKGSDVDLRSRIRYLGTEIHLEPERMASCWTTIFVMDVHEDEVVRFDGEWKVFADADDQEIVEHHRRTLTWVLDPFRQPLADLR